MKDISTPGDIAAAQVLVFPGVGSVGNAMTTLVERGLLDALRQYVSQGRPYFGICLGMQTLFEGSEESPGVSVRLKIICISWELSRVGFGSTLTKSDPFSLPKRALG